jgi:hypothetical protein
MRLLREARIAYLLTLWPLVLFLFSLGVTIASSFRVHVLEPLAIFALGTIIGLPALAPALSSMVGAVVAFGIRGEEADDRTTKIATRAVVLGLTGLALYLYLFLGWFGFGR